jgi:hypothetical protein
MRQTLRLGRIADIRVGEHWSVLVIAALLVQGPALTVLPIAAPGRSPAVYWLLAVVGAVLFLRSLLAHELARAFFCTLIYLVFRSFVVAGCPLGGRGWCQGWRPGPA